MTYELAKNLKDAGFPQKKLEISGVYAGVCKHGLYGFSEGRESCDCGEAETVHFPTLSELIEACGEEFHALIHWPGPDAPNRWQATSRYNGATEHCLTPLEAVARLWLALNKK